MKELLFSLEKADFRPLTGTLISLLSLVTGVLAVIAIQGHALTTGKNLEQKILALLAVDSVEETVLTIGGMGWISAQKVR